MAIDQESFNKRLYDIFKTRGYKPSPKDAKNERTNPESADVFEFSFIKDGDNYGKAWATIDKTSSLNIYYDDNQAGSPPGQTKGVDYDDSWSGLLKHLKQWALSKQLNFGLHDSDRLGDDMRQRDYYKMKEKMNEGYHAVNQKTSYNDNIPNVKVVIQHDRAVQEGEQRWRNVHKIFVENTEGERFAVPTRMPGLARVYGRHVAEGGTPYDDRGKHITSLVEEYTKMAGFVRATRRGEFNESTQKLIHEGVQHHKALKESLQKMQSHRGYNLYFESWTPALMEDEMDSSNIAEMFAQETIDPRIESVLPILSKLNGNIINEIEEVNELDQWARGITEITEEVIEEEKRDTHCSAKCCGADVKAEDCGCSPDCEHCNCNAKIEEGIVDKAITAAAGKIASNPEVQKQISGMASSAGKSAGDAAVSQVNKAIPGAVNTATDQAISNLKGPAIATGAAIAGGAGLAAYGGTKLANKQNKEKTNEGAYNKLVVDALEMSKEEFAKKHPAFANRYNDIIDSHSDDDYTDRMSKPEQAELDLNEAYMRSYVAEEVNKIQLTREAELIIAKIENKTRGKPDAFKAELYKEMQEMQEKMNSATDAGVKENLNFKFRLLQKRSQGLTGDKASNALDAATKDAQKKADNVPQKKLDMTQKVDIGKAGVGIIGALLEIGESYQIDEFQRGEFGGDRDDRPKKGKLVTKDGQEVTLPLRTEDFRGDEMIITGYQAPHKSSSTGRIYTDDGMSYFPSVANLKIIDHDFSDDVDEALTGNLAGSVAGSLLGAPGGIPGQLAGGIIGGVVGDKAQDKIDDFGKVDEERMSSEDDDLRDEESGKNHDPKTGKRTKPHPFDPEEDIDETKSGGMTFAGDYKTGKAGQWRNTGPTKGRPAKVGDLVGAEGESDIDYRHGDAVIIDGAWHELSLDKDGTLYATDEDGGEHEFVKGSESDHGHPKDAKDHRPDNVSESALNDILRLSGRTEYTGKSTGKGAGTEYKGYGR